MVGLGSPLSALVNVRSFATESCIGHTHDGLRCLRHHPRRWFSEAQGELVLKCDYCGTRAPIADPLENDP